MAELDRIRVAVLIDSLYDGVGGAERFALGLAMALPNDRFDVTVWVTRTASGRLLAELEEAGVACNVLNRRGRLDLPRFAPLVRSLRRDGTHILHAHKIGSNIWGTLIGRLVRVPVVIAHEHTWSYEGQPLRRLIDGWFIGRLATRFVAVSNRDRERMISIENVPAHRVVYLPTAYIPRPAPPGDDDLGAALDIPDGARAVGTLASLRPQKALTVLIDAFAGLGEGYEDTYLVIAGDGPEREALEAHAGASGASERIRFPGVEEDLGRVFSLLDVAAMSSDFEGMPLFLFEAMAHGTPVVATAVGGIPDVIVDGETGLLCPPRDAGALAGALAALLDDPERREAMAAAGRERLQQFTLEAVTGRFADLYETLLGGGSAAPSEEEIPKGGLLRSSFDQPLAQGIDPERLGPYPIDLTVKAGVPSWPPASLSPLTAQAWVDVIQWGLGAHGQFLRTGDEAWLDAALAVARDLMKHQQRDGWAPGAWVHPWSYAHSYRLPAPWISGMAQGQAASLFVRLHQHTGREELAAAARTALEPLGRTREQGGARTAFGDGWLLEEYPTELPSLVLNGAIFALWGYRDVAVALGDEAAAAQFSEGSESLAAGLHRWDDGRWSLYDLYPRPIPCPANPAYHRLHIDQLRAQHLLTGDPRPAAQADRFERYAASRVLSARAFAAKVAFRLAIPRNPRLAARVPWGGETRPAPEAG